MPLGEKNNTMSQHPVVVVSLSRSCVKLGVGEHSHCQFLHHPHAWIRPLLAFVCVCECMQACICLSALCTLAQVLAGVCRQCPVPCGHLMGEFKRVGLCLPARVLNESNEAGTMVVYRNQGRSRRSVCVSEP